MTFFRFILAAALLAAPACAQVPAAAPRPAIAAAVAVGEGLPSATPPGPGRAPMSDTVKAAVDSGYLMVLVDGQKVDIAFRQGGELDGMLATLGGTWWADGAELCINVPGFAERQCLTWPEGKKSGDTFGIPVKSGVITMTIH